MANIDTLKGKLTAIANAIRQKTGRSALLDLDEMPPEILSIDGGGGGDVPNPDDPLLLVDWDGTTLLYSYTYEDAQLISEFPDPPTHDGLTFQGWNWSEVIAKTWLQNHRGAQLRVGAMYTPTDGQDHNFWRSPRLSMSNQICMQHRATMNVGSSTFQDFQSLVSISLPNGLTSIGTYAFQNCYSLAAAILPSGLTSIGDSAFANCNSLTSASFPNGLTRIGDYAFYSCSSLTSASLPNGVTSIGSSAFQSCYSLAAIILSNGLININGAAFASCNSLPKIDIPASVTLIGSYAFNGCTSLVDVVIHGTPALGGSVVFGNNPSNQRYYVHRSDLSWFSTATNWSAIYGEGKIVAAADYIDYLQSIGIDTTDFEGE